MNIYITSFFYVLYNLDKLYNDILSDGHIWKALKQKRKSKYVMFLMIKYYHSKNSLGFFFFFVSLVKEKS